MPRSLRGAVAALALFVSCVAAAAQPARERGWTTYADGHGTVLDFPANVFTHPEGAPPVGSGRRFRTADGRAEVSVYTVANGEHATPRAYLSRHLKSDFSHLHYDRVGDRFFAVSGIVRGKTFYSRCNFEGRHGPMHCIYLAYPAGETHAWDALVTRMSLSLRADSSRATR